MEAKRPPTSIEQWYEYAMNLDRHWRESRMKEERLRGKIENGNQGQRIGGIGNNMEGLQPRIPPP